MAKAKGRKSSKVKVTFVGQNASGVTGSSILITYRDTKILLELGMSQESTMLNNYRNNESFLKSVDFDSLDYIILCDSHVDHSALIPAAVRRGFEGYVIMTPNATRITKHLMEDCAHIMEKDSEYMTKNRGISLKPFYTVGDIVETFEKVIQIPLNTPTKLRDAIEIEYLRNNHNLGSASLSIVFTDKSGRKKRLFYSSDLGNISQDMPFTSNVVDSCKSADVAIFESTYGEKPKEVINRHTRRSELYQLRMEMAETLFEKGGTVIFPAFAFQRSQQLLKHIKTIFDKDERFENIPIIFDGRLMNNINKEFSAILKDEQLEEFEELMTWRNVVHVTSFEETQAILNDNRPKIVISSSGMASNGKVVAYLEKYIGRSNTLIVFNGYCSQNSLGYRLLEKIDSPDKGYIKIGDKMHHFRAKVVRLKSFSSHMQYADLIKTITSMRVSKGIYLVHGSTDAKQSLLDGVREELQLQNKTTPVKIPRRNSSIEF